MNPSKLNRLKQFLCTSLIAVYFLSPKTMALALGIDGNVKFQNAWKALMSEYRIILAGISGVGALTAILVFIFHMIQLASMPSHPIQRRSVLTGLLISGICVALMGSSTLILTLFYEVIWNP